MIRATIRDGILLPPRQGIPIDAIAVPTENVEPKPKKKYKRLKARCPACGYMKLLNRHGKLGYHDRQIPEGGGWYRFVYCEGSGELPLPAETTLQDFHNQHTS